MRGKKILLLGSLRTDSDPIMAPLSDGCGGGVVREKHQNVPFA